MRRLVSSVTRLLQHRAQAFTLAMVIATMGLIFTVSTATAQDGQTNLYLPQLSYILKDDKDTTFISHYDPVYIVDITGRIYVNRGRPNGRTVLYAGGTGNMAQYVVNWQVGDFTGFFPTAEARKTQRGIPEGTYGSSAVQMEGFTTGIHLRAHPDDTSEPSQFAQLYYGFEDEPRPWGEGVNPRFCVDQELAVPQSFWTGQSFNYVYLSMALIDGVTGQRLWILPSYYDSRPEIIARGDNLVLWSETNEPILYTYLQAGNYLTPLPVSSQSTSSPWSEWRYFGFCITEPQFNQLITDINAQFQLSLSDSLQTYYIESFGMGPEMYNPAGNAAAVSARIRDVRLFTVTDAVRD
ncbi:MAG: hypothetical protein KDD78_15970 [Caldilineaceae bacterium]|nr:hypothetical protein [Caldilineaceae bacterium]